MNSKEIFDEELRKKIIDIDKSIKDDDLTDEEKDALDEAKTNLINTKKASDKAEKFFGKYDERTEIINKWKEDTEYEYIKNIDIINATIDSKLRNTMGKWYESFKGENIINKSELINIIDSLKYDELLMKDIVELETKVKRCKQDISGQEEYCVSVDYIFRMDENMAMHKIWKFDISDIIRSKRMDWLFS